MLLLAGTCLGHHQPRSLSIPQHLCPSRSLISGTFPYFPDLSSSHTSPSISWTPHPTSPHPFFFFPRPLLPFAKPSSVHHLFFPGPYTPSFRNPDSLGKEAQHMIGLLIGGTLSSLSLNWKIQDVTLLFSPGVIKIYSQPIPAAASK